MQTQGRSRTAMAEINVTPFVDVMLVLLIIFMVTAPMMTTGLNVELPEVEKAVNVTGDSDTVTVSIDAKGNIYVGKTQVQSTDKLGAVVTQALESKKQRGVHLEADKSVPYGKVAKVVAALQSAGVKEMGLVTEMDSSK